jgi:ActR/RegA family two-component response regulator
MSDRTGGSAGASILLIENHDLLRAATALGLHRAGFVVHSAAGVVEGLRLLGAHPEIAVAVLEIELGPGGPNGFAFVAAALLTRPNLGFVLLTGRADMLVGRTARPREVHLVKPCPLPRVAAAIRALLPRDDHDLTDAAQ